MKMYFRMYFSSFFLVGFIAVFLLKIILTCALKSQNKSINNYSSGHFLYVTKPDILKKDWTSFQSPPLAPTNDTHPCRVCIVPNAY